MSLKVKTLILGRKGASEYFQRTENIAGVKVGILKKRFIPKAVLNSPGYAFSSLDARCITNHGFFLVLID